MTTTHTLTVPFVPDFQHAVQNGRKTTFWNITSSGMPLPDQRGMFMPLRHVLTYSSDDAGNEFFFHDHQRLSAEAFLAISGRTLSGEDDSLRSLAMNYMDNMNVPACTVLIVFEHGEYQTVRLPGLLRPVDDPQDTLRYQHGTLLRPEQISARINGSHELHQTITHLCREVRLDLAASLLIGTFILENPGITQQLDENLRTCLLALRDYA